MSETIVVRRAQHADVEILCELLKAVHPDTKLDASNPSHFAHVTRSVAAPNCYVFVALEGGRAVGYTTAYRFPRLNHPSEQLYLFDVEVIPSARRLRIGKRLVEQIFRAARADGVTWAWAGTARDNVAAQRLFESVGGKKGGETYVEYEFE